MCACTFSSSSSRRRYKLYNAAYGVYIAIAAAAAAAKGGNALI